MLRVESSFETPLPANRNVVQDSVPLFLPTCSETSRNQYSSSERQQNGPAVPSILLLPRANGQRTENQNSTFHESLFLPRIADHCNHVSDDPALLNEIAQPPQYNKENRFNDVFSFEAACNAPKMPELLDDEMTNDAHQGVLNLSFLSNKSFRGCSIFSSGMKSIQA